MTSAQSFFSFLSEVPVPEHFHQPVHAPSRLVFPERPKWTPMMEVIDAHMFRGRQTHHATATNTVVSPAADAALHLPRLKPPAPPHLELPLQ